VVVVGAARGFRLGSRGYVEDVGLLYRESEARGLRGRPVCCVLRETQDVILWI